MVAFGARVALVRLYPHISGTVGDCASTDGAGSARLRRISPRSASRVRLHPVPSSRVVPLLVPFALLPACIGAGLLRYQSFSALSVQPSSTLAVYSALFPDYFPCT